MDIIALFDSAVKNNASDLILTANTCPMLRVNGELYPLGQNKLTDEQVKSLLYSVIDASQKAKFENTRELDFSIALPGDQRFRGNAYIQRGAVCAVFRVIPTKIPSLADLKLPSALERICMAPHGLFLITGATGMGKSTTLAAMVGYINANRNTHIITIEDPIEFVHTNDRSVIDQREVGTDTVSFPVALKQALRQSPDVILVGEMRDLETIGTALTAAETGHLVLATLHTRDAAQSVERIVDSFPGHQQNQIREQLSASLLGIMSQRLFPLKTGKGRVVATELMLHTTAVANLIRERKIHQLPGIIQTNSKIGMHTFEMSLKELLLQRLISADDVALFLTKSIG